MQVNSNGIPIDIPQRKRETKIRTSQILHDDFYKYKKFATMQGLEDGFKVIVVVPMQHPDFKKLKKQGYRVIEIWERKQKGEIA